MRGKSTRLALERSPPAFAEDLSKGELGGGDEGVDVKERGVVRNMNVGGEGVGGRRMGEVEGTGGGMKRGEEAEGVGGRGCRCK